MAEIKQQMLWHRILHSTSFFIAVSVLLRTDSMKLPLTVAERVEIQVAAELAGAKPVTWARETLLKAAQRIQKQHGGN